MTILLSGHSEACINGSWTAGELVSITTSEIITTSNKHSHELHMWEFPARAARNAEPQTLKDHTTVMCTSIAASLRLQLTVSATSYHPLCLLHLSHLPPLCLPPHLQVIMLVPFGVQG